VKYVSVIVVSHAVLQGHGRVTVVRLSSMEAGLSIGSISFLRFRSASHYRQSSILEGDVSIACGRKTLIVLSFLGD
jgi:hypothetical protein